MKVIVGNDRITIEPETDAERVLLTIWRDREGQKTSLQWDEFTDMENKKGQALVGLCLYINFDLIIEEEK